VTLKFIFYTLRPAAAKLAAPHVGLRALREVRSCNRLEHFFFTLSILCIFFNNL